MKLEAVTKHAWFIPAVGAAVTVLCGLLLHTIPLGEKWENVSYDWLFRFSAAPTNHVVLVAMDNSAYHDLHQVRGQRWDRGLHAQLLRKLAADKASLVVFDVYFGEDGATTNDGSLADAMRAQGHVVLMEKTTEPGISGAKTHEILLPQASLMRAAAGFGIGEVDEMLGRDHDQPPRRHYPFPSPGEAKSMAWVAAELSGASLSTKPEERWLRYYGERPRWETLSYQYALQKEPGYFSNKIVFVGQEPDQPESAAPEYDKFHTPFGTEVGGVEIHATTYLNLTRGDWLRRVSGASEISLLIGAGLLLGGCLCLVKRPMACGIAAVVFGVVMVGAIVLSFYTNYWFDWMTVAGGQLPVALAWSLGAPMLRRRIPLDKTVVLSPSARAAQGLPESVPVSDLPDAPDYQFCQAPFGAGAYGKVWLVRNAIGQWQALKAVYQSAFGEYTAPYEREFNGISRYKPVSEKHPGLLRIEFISRKKPEGYFYYVMELGDSLSPDWEHDPSLYKARDLNALRNSCDRRRISAKECIRICLDLCEALDFLHSQGLTHRDIKPGNIIFVRGRPKLADVGLIAEIRPNAAELTWVGTPAYMPPPPEPPGTVQADIYGLGMVLYVIRTGRDPEFFPGVSTSLAESDDAFVPLNNVILKACNPDIAQRYSSAGEMRADLLLAEKTLEEPATKTPS